MTAYVIVAIAIIAAIVVAVLDRSDRRRDIRPMSPPADTYGYTTEMTFVGMK